MYTFCARVAIADEPMPLVYRSIPILPLYKFQLVVRSDKSRLVITQSITVWKFQGAITKHLPAWGEEDLQLSFKLDPPG